MRTQTENNSNLLKEQRLCGSFAPDALGKMLKAMEELDAPENTPEGLNPSTWERFCLVRRTKVEIEQKVKWGHGQVNDWETDEQCQTTEIHTEAFYAACTCNLYNTLGLFPVVYFFNVLLFLQYTLMVMFHAAQQITGNFTNNGYSVLCEVFYSVWHFFCRSK